MPKVTKEIIIETALNLYSVNGYESTSMTDLAGALGIKAPTLYFHYKNKQALFDTIIETMRDYFWKSYPAIHATDDVMSDCARLYAENFELATQSAVKTFLFYYNDKYAGTFRKLLSIERYRNPQMDEVFRELYVDAPINNQTELFSEMIKQGYMSRELNPKATAYELYAPMFLIIAKYDCMPEKTDEAITEIETHIKEFLDRYVIK